MLEFLSNYDALIGIGASWLVAAWIYYRARADWRSKSFTEQINFSLNDIRDDRLVLRTLFEGSAPEILVSPAAVAALKKATRTTTVDQPFFSFENDEDWGFVMRAFLNVLSEMAAPVFVAQALRQPVAVGRFVFGATFECYGEMNTRKVRVLLIEEGLLKQYFGHSAGQGEAGAEDPLAGVQFDDPKHADRLTTLKAMAKLYFSDAASDRRFLRTVELGFPGAGASASA